MEKKLIIIKASSDISDQEVNNIVSQAELYKIETTVEETFTVESLKNTLFSGSCYDYIYLATHGCESHWGSISGNFQVTWIQFAAMICESGISKPNTIFMHSCCRGGLNQVAWSMFYCCEKIQFVCGPRFQVQPMDLITAFTIFLYNVEVKRIDPAVAAEKVLAATDIRLKCFDRVEEISQASYHSHCIDIKPHVDEAFGFRLEDVAQRIDGSKRTDYNASYLSEFIALMNGNQSPNNSNI